MLSQDSLFLNEEKAALFTIQQKATEQILFSIAEKGLKPKTTLKMQGIDCIGSGDAAIASPFPISQEWDGSFICINEINLDNAPGKDFATKTKPLMDEISVGAWPITLEREYKLKFKDKNDLLQEMEERLKHSLLLVLKPQPNAPFAKPIYANDEASIPSYKEKRFKEAGVPADQIVAIITPKSLQATAQKYFPHLPLYLIEFAKDKVTFPLYEVMKYWPNREIAKDIRTTLQIPNFRIGLESYFKDYHQKTFACHVVRLPTIKDVEYGLENQVGLYVSTQKLIQQEQSLKEQEIVALQAFMRMLPIRQTFLNYYNLHKVVQQKLANHQLEACVKSLPALQELQQKLITFSLKV